MGLFMALSNATSAVGYHRPGFVKWVRERPEECTNLLRGLRIAAFGHPDAAQLVQELEELLTRTSMPLLCSPNAAFNPFRTTY